MAACMDCGRPTDNARCRVCCAQQSYDIAAKNPGSLVSQVFGLIGDHTIAPGSVDFDQRAADIVKRVV